MLVAEAVLDTTEATTTNVAHETAAAVLELTAEAEADKLATYEAADELAAKLLIALVPTTLDTDVFPATRRLGIA